METKVSKEVLLDFYRKMNCIRAFENEAIELAKMNLTRAAVHTYNGEEAIAVGVCAHLTNHDYITSTHRGHGHCVAKGADLERMFAELMARENGYSVSTLVQTKSRGTCSNRENKACSIMG